MLAVHLQPCSWSCSCSLCVLTPSCPTAGTCLIPRPASGDTSWGWEVSRAGDTALLVMSLVPHPRDTAETRALSTGLLGTNGTICFPPAVHPEAPAVEGCMCYEEVFTGLWVLSDQDCPSDDGSSDILEQLPQLGVISCRPTGLLCSLFSSPGEAEVTLLTGYSSFPWRQALWYLKKVPQVVSHDFGLSAFTNVSQAFFSTPSLPNIMDPLSLREDRTARDQFCWNIFY